MNFLSKALQKDEEILIPLVVLENYKESISNRYRLILVKEGSGIVIFGENRFNFISPCLFCLSDRESSIKYASEKPLQTVEIVFHPALLHDDYEHADPERILIQAFTSRCKDYWGIMQLDVLSAHRLEDLMVALTKKLKETEDEYWVCRSRSLLLEALLLTDRLYFKQVQENDSGLMEKSLPSASPLVNELLNYLHTHYEEPLSIDSLSKGFHINRTTLSQTFKEEVKLSIAQYLIELRIEVAKVLLKGTLLQIAEIMTRVGYTDLAHFNRSFKQKVGCTPSKFREKFSNNQ